MCTAGLRLSLKWCKIEKEKKTSPPRRLWRTAQINDCSGPREHTGAWRCDLPPAAGTPGKHEQMLPFWTLVHYSKRQQANLKCVKRPLYLIFLVGALVFVFFFGFFCKQKCQDHERDVVTSRVHCVVNIFRCRPVPHYLTCAPVCFLPVPSNTFKVNNGGWMQLLWKEEK